MTTNREVYENIKPEGPKPVGRMNNESEKMTDLVNAPVEEEIGVVNNDASGGEMTAEPEIGRINNDQSDTQGLPDPEIGMINNEPEDEAKLPEPIIDVLKNEPPVEHSPVLNKEP